jgi:hypothetical protein
VCDSVRYAQFIYLIFKYLKILSFCVDVCARECVCVCVFASARARVCLLLCLCVRRRHGGVIGKRYDFTLLFSVRQLQSIAGFPHFVHVLSSCVDTFLILNMEHVLGCGFERAPMMLVICIVGSVHLHDLRP